MAIYKIANERRSYVYSRIFDDNRLSFDASIEGENSDRVQKRLKRISQVLACSAVRRRCS